jgi:hypothetical protein
MIARSLAMGITAGVAVGVASVSMAAWAGPGSRLRTTREVPQAIELTTAPTPPEVKGCGRLRGEQREQCFAALRESTPGRPSSGPEATGMGSGAGASATTGNASATAGGASVGGSAPR